MGLLCGPGSRHGSASLRLIPADSGRSPNRARTISPLIPAIGNSATACLLLIESFGECHLGPRKSRSGKLANSGSAGSRVTDYRAEDLLMKKRCRMCSAMAFIKSGGALFPTRAHPRQIPDPRHYSDLKSGVVAVMGGADGRCYHDTYNSEAGGSKR